MKITGFETRGFFETSPSGPFTDLFIKMVFVYCFTDMGLD